MKSWIEKLHFYSKNYVSQALNAASALPDVKVSLLKPDPNQAKERHFIIIIVNT